MKKLFISMLLCASALTATAGAKTEPMLRFKGDAPITFMKGQSYDCLTIPRERIDAKARAEEAGHTITIKGNYNTDDYYAYPVDLLSLETGEDYMGFFQDGECTVEDVPTGKYIVLYTFKNQCKPLFPTFMLIIHDDVEVNGDVEWTVDPEEADKVIAFSSVLPDGKEPVLPTAPGEEGVNENDYDWTGATAKNVGAYTLVYKEGFGLVTVTQTNQLYTTPSKIGSIESMKIAVNDISDKWSMSQLREVQTIDDKYYYSMSSVSGTDAAPPVNSTDFCEWEFKFATNPVTGQFGLMGHEYGLLPTPLFENKAGSFGFWMFGYEETPRIFLSEPKSVATSSYPVNYCIRLQKNEYEIEEENNGWMMQEQAGINPMPVYFDTQTQSVAYAMAGVGMNGSPLWWNKDDSHNVQVLPGNTNFACPASGNLLPLGYTAPVNVTAMVVYEGDPYPQLSFSSNYVGIYGEDRGADGKLGSAYVIPKDEEEVFCDMRDLALTIRTLAGEGKLVKPFDIELANDGNILVDGIKGKTITKLHYADPSQGNLYGPTATMLQFRDSEGVVNNTFNTPEDGSVLLSGGDFNLVDVWECAPVTLKVEYAPAGSNEFRQLTMTEEPGNFFMPAFGYFWHGDLSAVATKSENGWFQLRISMSDSDGNTQEQTIYPAFKILSLAGVDRIADDMDESTDAVYYNLQGLRIDKPVDGSVVIRRQGGKTSKVVCK